MPATGAREVRALTTACQATVEPVEGTGQTARVRLASLIGAFLLVGATSFGSHGSSHLFRELVQRRRWIAPDVFVEGQSLGRLLPGPGSINTLVYAALTLRGRAAVLVVLPPYFLPGALLMAAFTQLAFGGERPPVVEGAFRGLGAAIAGLLVANMVQLWPTGRRGRLGPLFVLLAFLAHGPLGVDLLTVLGGLGAVSLLLNRPKRP